MTKVKIVYRLAKRKDCQGILEVNEKSLPVVYSRYDWEMMVNQKMTYIVTQSALIVGYITCDKSGCIVSFAVSESHRHQGLGRQLLKYCLEEMKKLNYKRLILRVKVSNHIAHQLYLSQGFKDAELLSNYYEDGCDGMLMSYECS